MTRAEEVDALRRQLFQARERAASLQLEAAAHARGVLALREENARLSGMLRSLVDSNFALKNAAAENVRRYTNESKKRVSILSDTLQEAWLEAEMWREGARLSERRAASDKRADRQPAAERCKHGFVICPECVEEAARANPYEKGGAA